MNHQERIRNAWIGRISGCQLGKPVELLSMQQGYQSLADYLKAAGALPLRDYIPYLDDHQVIKACCKGYLQRSEPDDDINYSYLALSMLEQFGSALTTEDVARTWLKTLPVASTFTAERAAYRILITKCKEWFPEGAEVGFDIGECADNPYNDWIGAQIRTDLYGWVLPGRPVEAARLAMIDAQLSHQGDGIYGAVFVAALGAAMALESPDEALQTALTLIPTASRAAEAVRLGMEVAGDPEGGSIIREKYTGLSPVHTINNLALVVWSLYSHLDSFSAAIGDVVTAGLDTDCNGATVGALWGLQGKPIPEHWHGPWRSRVGLSLAGLDEISLE